MSSEATKGQTPDVYGQLHPVETILLLESKQKEFKTELDKIPAKDKKYVLQAEEKCPELLTEDFILQFLRCEVFNADLAAIRYCNYWKKRVEIFGPERAFQPLTMDGAMANPDVQKHFDIGIMTLLKAQDPDGRALVYYDPSLYPPKSEYNVNDMIQSFWYVFHAALEDVNAQKHGVIVIGDPGRAKFSQFDRSISKSLIGSLKGAIPVRLSAFHMVHPPSFVNLVFPIIRILMPERMRKRIVFHTGSDEKVLKELESKYGLTKAMLPTTVGGEMKIQHKEWLKERSSSGL